MMKNNKGFSLVEIAIVLVIFGVILTAATSVLTLFVNKGEAERTRSMIESNKNSLFSFVATNNQLPTAANFPNNVTYPNDGYNVQFRYFADPILDKSRAGWGLSNAPFNDINTVCGSTYTNTVVTVCSNADCSTSTDVNNVAFVIMSGSENKNVQTGVTTAVNINTITVFTQGSDARDSFTADMNRPERYDDIVDWVTLDELKTRAGCDPEAFRFLNITMPAVEDSVAYTFDFHLEGGVPYSSTFDVDNPEYEWVVRAQTELGTAFTAGGFTTRQANGNLQATFTNVDPTSLETRRGAFLRVQANTAALTGQYWIDVFVYDNALDDIFTLDELITSGNAYHRRFFVNIQ